MLHPPYLTRMKLYPRLFTVKLPESLPLEQWCRVFSAQYSSLVSYRSLDQTTTSSEEIAARLRLMSVDWFWRGCRHVSRLFWISERGTWRVSHCGCSIDRREQRRRFVSFVEMPSVTSQLSMLSLSLSLCTR